MSYGYLLEAEYRSGLILTETEQDRSPYEATDNFFAAIRHGSATKAGHGEMVRFSLIPVGEGNRYDIDWTGLADLDNPRPIYFRRMASTINADGTGDGNPYCTAHGFGYQYNDADGNNVQVVEEIQ
jgi:hypothetical protein